MIFVNRVRELRKRAGMAQKELVAAVGVSQPTVSEWEQNKKDPSGERLEKLEEIFRVSKSVILGYDDIPEEEKPITNNEAQRLFQIPQIVMMGREMEKMTEEQRNQMLAIGRALFKEYFGKEPEE